LTNPSDEISEPSNSKEDEKATLISELSNSKEDEKATLISELKQAGIKHTPEKIIRIAKLPNSKIIFLEEGIDGKGGRGLKHILQEHQENFAKRGISPDQIPDAVIAAVVSGTIIAFQKTRSPTPRIIYEFIFNGETQYLAVTVGDNGYIVGANPAPRP